MKKTNYIFFDLDHTLWDYDANAQATLKEMYSMYDLQNCFSSPEAFIKQFYHVNYQLWDDYNHKRIDRDYIRKYRFQKILEGRISEDWELFDEMSVYFVSSCPKRTTLMPGALELLEELCQSYEMGILTNGFDDVQQIKLNSSGLSKYFQCVITSETTGSRKPDPSIFDHALEVCNKEIEEVIMVGDNPITDISGAIRAGWDAVWYNPDKRDYFQHEKEINHLKDLLNHL